MSQSSSSSSSSSSNLEEGATGSSKKKFRRTSTAAAQFTTREDEDVITSLGQDLAWEFSYDYKVHGLVSAADTKLNWYPAKIIDVVQPQDPRYARFTSKHTSNQRAPQSLSGVSLSRKSAGFTHSMITYPKFESIRNGNWLKIHFQGWSAQSDEWILFKVGGYVCLAFEEGEEEEEDSNGICPPEQCFCLKHYDAERYARYVAQSNNSGSSDGSAVEQETRIEPQIEPLMQVVEAPPAPAAASPAAAPAPVVLMEEKDEQEALVVTSEQAVPAQAPVALAIPSSKQAEALEQILREESEGFFPPATTAAAAATTVSSTCTDKVSANLDLLFSLDSKTGVPVLAKEILDKECRAKNMTVERLLRDGIHLDSLILSGRRWLAGKNLLRPSVLRAGSIIVEWWEAKRESRAPRDVQVDIQQVEQYLRVHHPKLLAQASKHTFSVSSATTPAVAVVANGAEPSTNARYKKVPQPPAITLKRSKPQVAAPPVPTPTAAAVQSKKQRVVAARAAAAAEEEEEGEDSERELAPPTPAPVAAAAPIALDSALYHAMIAFKLCAVFSSSTDRELVQCTLDIFSKSKRYALFATQEEAMLAEKRAKPAVEKRFAELQLARQPNADAAPACSLCSPAPDSSLSPSTSSCCAECEAELLLAAISAVPGGLLDTGRKRQILVPLKSPEEESYYIPAQQQYDMSKQPKSTTLWRGSAFPTAPNRVAEQRTYFTKFAFRSQDSRAKFGDFQILDHVILSRRSCFDEVVEEEQENSPDYFVAQIEALWEETNRKTGEREKFCRVNWFFWPEEANPQMKTYAEVGGGAELFTSNEVDIEPVHRVLAKTRVLCALDFERQHVPPPTMTDTAALSEQITAPKQQPEAEAAEELAEASARIVSPSLPSPSPSPSLSPREQASPSPAPAQQQQQPPQASASAPKRRSKANAPTFNVGDMQLRGCIRCGMNGFSSPSELSAHKQRFCGADSVELLQRRRSEAGREVLVGIYAPSEPTIACEPVQYPSSSSNYYHDHQQHADSASIVLGPRRPKKKQTSYATTTHSSSKEEELLQNEYVNADVVARALNRAEQGPFFARDHFYQRKNLVTKPGGAGDGQNALQASLLFATSEATAETEYWTKSDAHRVQSCLERPAAISPEAVTGATQCFICYKRLVPELDVRFTCEVCPSTVTLCLECMRRGRQARGHLQSHAYHVHLSTLDNCCSEGRDDAEQALLRGKLPANATIEYSLVEITRLPLGRPRYRFGVTINGTVSLCADEFGLSFTQAKNQCALTCLRVFFGAATCYSFPMLSFEWTAWEASKLMDGLAQHGLAWETVAPLVGTKTAVECRSFYSKHFLDKKINALALNCAQQITLASRHGEVELIDLGFEPEDAAREDAVGFASRVRAFHAKRAAGRANLLGILNDTIYAAPPPKQQQQGSLAVHHAATCRDTTSASNNILTCLTCNEEFHSDCLTAEEREAQFRSGVLEWYCTACLEDERYVFEHHCWGEAGRVVCELACSRTDSEARAALVEQWEANGRCIAEITASVENKKLPSGVTPRPTARSKRLQMEEEENAAASASAKEGLDSGHAEEMMDPYFTVCRESLQSLRQALDMVRAERDGLLARLGGNASTQ